MENIKFVIEKSERIKTLVDTLYEKMPEIESARGILVTESYKQTAGPVGWILTGVWTAFDFASQAYRVTIPSCIYIAALRKMKENEKFAKEADAAK